MAPIRKNHSRGRYRAPDAKKRRGPMAPQTMLVLKCVREKGHWNPFSALLVQMLGI